MATPKATFISAPDEYKFHKDESKLLPWSWAREQLETAHAFWIATVGKNGAPHVTPVWGVWMDDKFYFDGEVGSRWGRNVEHNPHVCLHLESPQQVLIVEGTAEAVKTDTKLGKQIWDTWETKYNGKFMPDATKKPVYILTPDKARGWTTEWMSRGTRWEFDGE